MPEDTDTNTYRLRDMEVREVAFVDRAANRRRFLVVKAERKEDAMPVGAEVTTGPDGSLTANDTSGSVTPQTKDDAVLAEGSEPVAEPAGVADESEVEQDKAEVSLTEDAKKLVTDVINYVAEKLAAASAMVEGAQMVEGEGDMSAEPLFQALVECSDALSDVTMAAMQPPAEEMPEEEGVQAAAPSPPPMSKRHSVIRAQRVVRDAELDKVHTALMTKAGARMKKERLARLQQAHIILGDILHELTDSLKSTEAQPEPAPKTASKKLAEENENLRKQLQEAHAKLEKGRRAVSDTNTTPVEKGDDPKPFSWPLDMNRPLGRDDVEKGDFFGF